MDLNACKAALLEMTKAQPLAFLVALLKSDLQTEIARLPLHLVKRRLNRSVSASQDRTKILMAFFE